MKVCVYCNKELVKRPSESPARFEARIVCGRPCYDEWRSMKAAQKKVSKAGASIRRDHLWAIPGWAKYNEVVRKNAS